MPMLVWQSLNLVSTFSYLKHGRSFTCVVYANTFHVWNVLYFDTRLKIHKMYSAAPFHLSLVQLYSITQHTSRGCLSVSHSIQYYHNILTSSFKGTVLFHLLLMIDAGISELESTNSLMRGLNSLVICATLWIMQLPRKNQLNLVLTNKNNISIHAATDQNAFLLRKLSSHCC